MSDPKQLSHIPPRHRDLIFRVVDGNNNLFFLAYHIYNFTRGPEMFEWLVKNRITGQELQRWFKAQFDCSILAMAQFIIMKLEKEERPRAMHVGRDINFK